MKVVQTFWSGNADHTSPIHMKGGWESSEYNWMSWALSALLLRRHYDRLELYTDELGKKNLVDMLGLPYTKVHVVFDRNSKIHPKLFALAKIKTYSLQEEPFIHIDGDVFLWNPLPESLNNAKLIASNQEVDLFFNKEILKDMGEHFKYIPHHLKNVLNEPHTFASNAGIFGGTYLPFIKKYCSTAEQIIEENTDNLDKVNLGYLNMLVEQISLFYLARQENIKTEYYVSEPVDHPLYQDYWRFADIPEVPMIHPVGGCKKIPYVLHHLARRLQLEFPNAYYRILKLCKNGTVPLRNRFYDHLDFTTVENGHELNKSYFLGQKGQFLKLQDSIFNSLKFYRRTLLVAKHYYPNLDLSEGNLEAFVQQEGMPDPVKEVFLLETKYQKCLENLFLEIQKGEIYESELIHYQKTATFYMEPKWIQRKVVLKDGVEAVDLSKPWGLLNSEDPKKALVQILKVPRKKYCMTLSIDLLTLSVQESYYDELDAIIISLIKRPIEIESLLKLLLDYFDEEISIEDQQYKLLVFDVLKRLAFENIVTVL
ncbi:DUF6734 family protein [Flagellimonas allohymeniacidonis]|uniref:DUF6734 domain-containing protein n=1 Tax=Flagellimonas allohymeniacidonis TaxID=2517819 RepID=A0A4Q8QCF6_9FLAO|nr:DUF6734 family protein [Allomuricauda hymeniacidonis]TAI48092.1 hypothetical protein EW142_15710 [Allomuricauda hymeniacidonis]